MGTHGVRSTKCSKFMSDDAIGSEFIITNFCFSVEVNMARGWDKGDTHSGSPLS
jgi:hypothetical protein